MSEDLQECILESIRSFHSTHRYSPSFRELSEACGVSVVAVHYWLSRLKEQGKVDYRPGQPRTLVVIEQEAVET